MHPLAGSARRARGSIGRVIEGLWQRRAVLFC